MKLNRRSFLKGAAASGLFVAAGLTGCAPQPASNSSSPSTKTDEEGAAGHTWDTKPPEITEISQTEDYEVVVVGAGIAGINAFEAASEAGAKTLLIEQAEKLTAHGAYNGCIGAKIQLDEGINIDPEEAVRLMYRFSQQIVNLDLLRTWAYRSGEVMDHIIDLAASKGVNATIAVGQTAKGDWNTNPEPWREFRTSLFFNTTGNLGNADESGNYPETYLLNALAEIGEEHGGTIRYKMKAEQLVGDATSGISGVIARAEDGSYVQFNASKGVILATGDISGNKEMLDMWAPIASGADTCFYFPEGGNNGDGLLMGKWIGAGLSKAPAAPMIHPYSLTLPLTALDQSWLAVNKYGNRYGCEVPYEPFITNSRIVQPDGLGWSVFDSNYAEHVKKQHPDSWEDILREAEALMESAIASGELHKAETLEELADSLGIPADNFVKTVERYNGYCESGKDLEFDTPERFLSSVKEPPFFAGLVPTNMLCVPFGLHVDRNSQVCTDDDRPIKGLYAIGNVQGDFFAFSYPVICPGISHGRCLTFGQLVGKALAEGKTING